MSVPVSQNLVSRSSLLHFMLTYARLKNCKMNVGSYEKMASWFFSFWKLNEVAVCAVHKFGGDTDQKQCTEEGNRGVGDEMGSNFP